MILKNVIIMKNGRQGAAGNGCASQCGKKVGMLNIATPAGSSVFLCPRCQKGGKLKPSIIIFSFFKSLSGDQFNDQIKGRWVYSC